MFALNENVVYPGYGVARVNRVIERVVDNRIARFFELKFLHKDMTILVPVDNLMAVGVRALNSPTHVAAVFAALVVSVNRDALREAAANSWNKRNKKYQAVLRSGDLVEISKIYRDLQHLAQTKELSFGERALLLQTEILLAEEIAIIECNSIEHSISQLRALFMRGYHITPKQPMPTL